MGPDTPVIDIPAVAATLWRRRTWIVGTVAMVVATTLAVLLLRPDKFTASTRILIDPRGLQVVEKDLNQTNPAAGTDTAQVENKMRVLTSSTVLRRVVEREGLAADLEFGAKPPGLVGWSLKLLRTSFGMNVKTDPPDAKALRLLRRAVSTLRPQGSYVVDLFVTTRDAEKSARLADAVASVYVDSELGVRSDAAQRISESLTARAEELRTRVRDAEQKVEAYRNANDILGIGTAGVAATDIRLLSQEQLTQMNQQVSLAKARTSQAQARVDQIESLRAQGAGYSAFSDAVQSATVSQLRARYSAAREAEASLATTLGPRHPRLDAARAQTRDVESSINEELNRIARAARGDLERARADEADLVGRLEQLKRASVTTSQAQIRLRDLEREANASRIVYESFLVRSREISEQKGLDTSSERILSPAVAPIEPDGPNPLFLLAFAAAFAVGVGSVLALVREQFDNTVYSAAQVTALTGLPVLATVSDMTVTITDTQPAASDASALLCSHSLPAVVHHRPNSETAAVFRRLDGLFRNTGSAISLRTILITSVGQADGKSTVALNMALAAMEAGDRVLLVDGDPVNRTLTTAAAVPMAATPGHTLPVVPGNGVGLSLATPGSLALDTGDGINGRTVRSTIAGLAGDFDTVIIDGSALGAAPSLAALTDAASDVVVVVRAQTTVASRFVEAMPMLEAVGHKVRGAVFLDL